MGVLKEREREKLFEEVEKGERIEKEVSFSWDGKNLVVRFPKDVADYFGVNKENRFEKYLKFIVKENEGKVDSIFEIVKRTKLKRK